MKILLLGDISLNGWWADGNNEIYNEEIIKYFFEHDLVICNLETTVKSSAGVNTLKIPRIYTEPSAINSLKKYNINLCSLANNHMYDNLASGLDMTISLLRKNQIQYVGLSEHKICHINHSQNSENINLSILSYVDNKTNPCLPTDYTIVPSFYKINDVVKDIMQEKSKNNFVIIKLQACLY